MSPTNFQKLSALALGLLACLGPVLRLHSEETKPDPGKTAFVYTLTITDRIRVSIFQEDDLTVSGRVDSAGNINLKLVGDVHVAGLNVTDAQHAIEAAYRDGRYLRNPQVTRC